MSRLTLGSFRASIWLAAAALVLLVGCATVAVPPGTGLALRDTLGVVALVPAEFVPQSKFLINWRHKEGAAGKQAALMAGSGTAATVGVAAVAAPIAVPVVVLGGVIATGVSAAVDAVRTSAGIVPADTAAAIESAISKAVAGQDVQNALAGRLATRMKTDTRIRLAAVSAAGPATPAARPDYAQLRTAGVDTVMEVAVTEIGFDGCIANNRECRPPHVLHLLMHAQARLVRVATGAVLFERTLEYRSGNRELGQWLADGGRLLGEEFEMAYRELAERIYDDVFLIAPIELPFISDMWESRCWLEPLYPEFQWLHGYRVDSLQPTLRWTAFPRDIDVRELDPALLRKIGNVTYDLRIWDEALEVHDKQPPERWRNRLFYARTGLAAPQHALDIPLAQGRRYYWSVRARFVMDGRPMATRWSRRSGCFSEALPFGYFEFDTPK